MNFNHKSTIAYPISYIIAILICIQISIFSQSFNNLSDKEYMRWYHGKKIAKKYLHSVEKVNLTFLNGFSFEYPEFMINNLVQIRGRGPAGVIVSGRSLGRFRDKNIPIFQLRVKHINLPKLIYDGLSKYLKPNKITSFEKCLNEL